MTEEKKIVVLLFLLMSGVISIPLLAVLKLHLLMAIAIVIELVLAMLVGVFLGKGKSKDGNSSV